MKKHIKVKLDQAQEQLGVQIPDYLYNFISELKKSGVTFGEEKWLFHTYRESGDENFIVSVSRDFREEWGLSGLVFAANGLGDYLLLLPNEDQEGFRVNIFVMMHETAEIKLFAYDWDTLLRQGPEYYYLSDEYCFKLDDDNNLVAWSDEQERKKHDDQRGYVGEEADEAYALRSELDDLIDDQATEKASDILEGLEKLSEEDHLPHKIWAINKLSDLYLRGFGPVPQNLEKALAYNQQGLELNSHQAYSNRAACYFAGIGMERDLQKALDHAVKANELSKSNMFASTLAGKEDGGMYEGLLVMIRKEIKKSKKN